MTYQPPGDENQLDLLIESNKKERLERPKKLQSLIDTQAMRFLEGMDFRSYNNLSSAFEQFMMEAPLFQADPSFSNAAMALDLTAQLFSTIDTDRNHLLSREEFAYLLLKTNDANRQALAWLTENFNAFTQACFFKDQIGKDDIEAARNVFHGLKVVHDKFGFKKQPTSENLGELDVAQIKDFLDGNRGNLSPHEAAGLKYLLDHIKKHGVVKEGGKAEDPADKMNALLSDKRLQVLDGVLDPRSLKTLQSMQLNSFENMIYAFADFVEDALSFRGNSPFSKAANAFDGTSGVVTQLQMGPEHMFTKDELLIVSKLLGNQSDKKQVGWVAKHFDAFTKSLFFSGKARKTDLQSAANVFDGLDHLRENRESHAELASLSPRQLRRQLRDYMNKQRTVLKTKQKESLDSLVEFMERHA